MCPSLSQPLRERARQRTTLKCTHRNSQTALSSLLLLLRGDQGGRCKQKMQSLPNTRLFNSNSTASFTSRNNRSSRSSGSRNSSISVSASSSSQLSSQTDRVMVLRGSCHSNSSSSSILRSRRSATHSPAAAAAASREPDLSSLTKSSDLERLLFAQMAQVRTCMYVCVCVALQLQQALSRCTLQPTCSCLTLCPASPSHHSTATTPTGRWRRQQQQQRRRRQRSRWSLLIKAQRTRHTSRLCGSPGDGGALQRAGGKPRAAGRHLC